MILVLIPTKCNLTAEVMYRSTMCEMNLRRACGQHIDIVRDFSGAGDTGIDPRRDERGIGTCSLDILKRRVAHTAPIRQALIDEFLTPEASHVLWIDADIVSYPASIIADLLAMSNTDIVAPCIFLESDPAWFYDTAGFVEDGKWCNWRPPHFRQPGPIVELDGVGCMYLVPAEVYRRGAKHEPVEGFTDHLAVCRFAKQQGFRVLCNTELKVQHADFRRYGGHRGT